MEAARTGGLASLRAEIARLERGGLAVTRPAALPPGIAAIDAQLPAAWLLLGAIQEVQAAGPDTKTGAVPLHHNQGPVDRPRTHIGFQRSL